MTTRSSCLRRSLTAAAFVVPMTAFAVDSSAQTTGGLSIGLNPQGLVTHTLPTGDAFMRDATLNPAGINFEDCERDVVLNYPLVASGSASAASGYALYAFAGTDCDQGPTHVSPGTSTATCWPVVDGPVAYNLSGGFNVSIRARQILGQYTAAIKEAYTTVAAGDDSVCHLQSSSAAFQVPVYFIFSTDEGLSTVAASGVSALNVDLLAATPPTTLSLDVFNAALKADWNASTDQDTVGYNVYYAPPAGTQGAADAGDGGATPGSTGSACPSPFPAGTVVAGDAGGNAGSIADLSMQPREAVQGQYPFATAASITSTSATFGGLTNGEEYAVGVAATDAYGNVGALSTVGGGDMVCQAPLASGGSPPSAGDDSGGCSLGAVGGPGRAGGTAMFAGAALVLALRRKKRARRDR